MSERIKRLLKAYATSAWIPLVVTLAITVILTVVIAWLQKHSIPDGTTFYDYREDHSLVTTRIQYFNFLFITDLVLLAMLIVGVFQLVTRLFVKGIVNIVLALLLFLPVTLIPVGILAALSECQTLMVCGFVSDERALRYEFSIPDEVELIELDSPTGSSFGQREGLKIDATFRFTPGQFERYLSEQVLVENGWKMLPIPRDLLWHIGRIEEYAKRVYERERGIDETLVDQGEASPPPTYVDADLRRIEAEHFEVFLQRIPPFPETGYYVCRTAGTNVLYAIKTSCDEPERVNDFILASLDRATLELRIKVSAYY